MWEERFQGTYGVLRAEVLATFDEYLNCGIMCHGAARVYCDGCKHTYLVAFSCKKRGVCPSCAAKRAVMFGEHLYEEVLEDVPHRHIVFTIPKRLRVYFRYDRRLNDILFKSAWRSISAVLSEGNSEPGVILTYQSAGEALNVHPHLHGLLSDGLFQPDGTFKRFEQINLKQVTEEFSNEVLSGLRGKDLITDAEVTQILSQEHTGFSVWVGEAFQDEGSEKFVARYVDRGPISLEKLSLQDDIVTYTTKDGVAHEFDHLEFLALLSAHIPRPYESVCRFYGHYSCRRRGERAKKEPPVTVTEGGTEPKQKASSSWAACLKHVYEFNPLECPKCRGPMRIISFLQDESAIIKIMDSLGLPPYTAPPPLPKGEQVDELVDSIPSDLDYL